MYENVSKSYQLVLLGAFTDSWWYLFWVEVFNGPRYVLGQGESKEAFFYSVSNHLFQGILCMSAKLTGVAMVGVRHFVTALLPSRQVVLCGQGMVVQAVAKKSGRFIAEFSLQSQSEADFKSDSGAKEPLLVMRYSILEGA